MSNELSDAQLSEWLSVAETMPPTKEVKQLDYGDFCELLRMALRSAEPSDEPVAPFAFYGWASNGDGTESPLFAKAGSIQADWIVRDKVPLYLHPPRPVSEPLSDERIREIAQEAYQRGALGTGHSAECYEQAIRTALAESGDKHE